MTKGKRGMPRRVDYERVVELHRKGVPKDAIAMRCGCCERTVRRIVAAARKERA